MTEDEHDGDWDGVRRAVAAHLDAAGRSHLAALADEFVSALAEARRLRAIARENPTTELKSGRVLLHPGFEGV